VFADATRCRIGDGHIHLGREEYEFVVLPGGDAIPVEVMRCLLQFYEAGGTVIMLGPGARIGSLDSADAEKEIIPRVPFRSADGRHDDEVKDLVARVWGTRASGRDAPIWQPTRTSRLFFTPLMPMTFGSIPILRCCSTIIEGWREETFTSSIMKGRLYTPLCTCGP